MHPQTMHAQHGAAWWSHDNVSPYGLLCTTVDGRFDARGTPGRPREDNEEGRDKHPLATPSLNVALRVQRAPCPSTGIAGGPSAQRPETTKTKATYLGALCSRHCNIDPGGGRGRKTEECATPASAEQGAVIICVIIGTCDFHSCAGVKSSVNRRELLDFVSAFHARVTCVWRPLYVISNRGLVPLPFRSIGREGLCLVSGTSPARLWSQVSPRREQQPARRQVRRGEGRPFRGRWPETAGDLSRGVLSVLCACLSRAPQERRLGRARVLRAPKLRFCAVHVQCAYSTRFSAH